MAKKTKASDKRSVITQSVVFPVPAKKLYETYINAKKHSAAVGAPVEISAEPGSPFSAFGGQLLGTTLSVVPNRLIIQSWRSNNFHEEDPDSTLILHFVDKGAKGQIDLVHLDVPEQDFEGVKGGWETYYWAQWKDHLAKKSAKKKKK